LLLLLLLGKIMGHPDNLVIFIIQFICLD